MPFNFIFNHNYYTHTLQNHTPHREANYELPNQHLSSLEIKTYLGTMAFGVLLKFCSHFILLRHYGLAKGSSQFSRNQYNDSNIKKKQNEQQGI